MGYAHFPDRGGRAGSCPREPRRATIHTWYNRFLGDLNDQFGDGTQGLGGGTRALEMAQRAFELVQRHTGERPDYIHTAARTDRQGIIYSLGLLRTPLPGLPLSAVGWPAPNRTAPRGQYLKGQGPLRDRGCMYQPRHESGQQRREGRPSAWKGGAAAELTQMRCPEHTHKWTEGCCEWHIGPWRWRKGPWSVAQRAKERRKGPRSGATGQGAAQRAREWHKGPRNGT